MRILHLNDKVENKGGVENYISSLCDGSKEFGIFSFWMGYYNHNNVVKIKCAGNIGLIFEGNSKDSIEYILSFYKEKKIDIIHIHSISNPYLISKLLEIGPVVRTMHEPRMFCPGQGKFWKKSESICNVKFGLKCFIYAYSKKCCNRNPRRLIKAYKNTQFEINVNDRYKFVHVGSDYMKNEAVKAGFSNNNIKILPFFTKKINEKNIRDASNDKIISLLFIGRLSITKGVHYAINSVVDIIKKGYKVRFDIIGSGHDENYFKSKVPSKYKSNIIFHGWKNKNYINKLLSNSYLLLFPSIYPEAFGISGIEAMMHGKPVVGFNVGGVSSWLFHDRTGFLVKPKDTEGLTKSIISLIKDTKKYRNFSINSRKMALQLFEEKKHFNRLIYLYEQILK